MSQPIKDESETAPADSVNRRRFRAAFLVIALVFLLTRVPVIFRVPASEDEDCYAVPGLTILETGLPRLPHVPARNRDSVYYCADHMLYAEPPLSFYAQAPLYALLPDVYGTARLLSILAGLGVLLLTGLLTWRVSGSLPAALSSMGLFSVSRWFYFAAIRARPDMLCALFGFLTIWQLLKWHEERRFKQLVLTGLWIGCGGLSHAFALVYAIQAAVWVAVAERGTRRLTRPLMLAGVSLAVAMLWLPLILLEPEIFRVQFTNQYFSESSVPIWQRFLFPWESIAFQLRYLVPEVHGTQFALAVVALTVMSVISMTRKDRKQAIVCALCWSAACLLCIFVGPTRLALGYWVYPGGLMFLCLGRMLVLLYDVLVARFPKPRLVAGGGLLFLLLLFAPGSGLRASWQQFRHWSDVNYNAPRFARRLMQEIPPGSVCVVDTEYTLDFIAAGYPTLWAQVTPVYLQADTFKFDVLVLSRMGKRIDLPKQLCTERVASFGIPNDLLACYAEIHHPWRSPCHESSVDTPAPQALRQR